MCTATSWNTNAAKFIKRFPDYDVSGIGSYQRLMIRPSEMQVTCLNDGRKSLQLHPFGTRIKPDGQAGRTVVNARRENLARSKMWSRLVGTRRCLVFISAFYECRHACGSMEVFRISESLGDSPASVSALAALYTQEGGVVVVTRPAEAEVLEVHDRMPAVLAEDHLNTWLNAPQADAMELLELPPVPLRLKRITPAAFKLPPDSPALLEAVDTPKPPPAQQELF